LSGGAIRVRGLRKHFGAVVALRDLDLDVSAGQLLAVLGPNGAGKSTLLRLLAGLSRPSSGEIAIDGQVRGRSRAAERRHIGFVGHATLLYSELTARENLIFAGRLYGVADAGERADLLLEAEGLADVSGQRAGTFSRGMSQRLSIARALMHDPDLVLLDEPYSGLDRRSAQRLSERLLGLRGCHTVVLVTHDPRTASEVANAAVVLRRGRAVLRAEESEVSEAALDRAISEPAVAAP